MLQTFWPAYKRILQRSSWPILVGPWRSEVGFEALYWIPFVQSLGIAPDRLIPISRGGAAVWYGTPTGCELYDLRAPKDVRIENAVQHAKTGLLKQTHMTAFDRAVLTDAAKSLNLTRYHVLHPSWMYQTLAPFWEGKKGPEWVIPQITTIVTDDKGETRRQLVCLRAPALPETVTLPQQYCVARFYARATFPYAPHTVELAKNCLRQIAAHQPVVLLNPGVHADEHVDLNVKSIPNVYLLKDLCPVQPRDNLALQSAVIAGATGFVGTYGGLAQLALRLEKPSVSFYWDWQGTAIAHKHLSEIIALQTGRSFLTMGVREIPLLKTVVPDVEFGGSSGG